MKVSCWQYRADTDEAGRIVNKYIVVIGEVNITIGFDNYSIFISSIANFSVYRNRLMAVASGFAVPEVIRNLQQTGGAIANTEDGQIQGCCVYIVQEYLRAKRRSRQIGCVGRGDKLVQQPIQHMGNNTLQHAWGRAAHGLTQRCPIQWEHALISQRPVMLQSTIAFSLSPKSVVVFRGRSTALTCRMGVHRFCDTVPIQGMAGT